MVNDLFARYATSSAFRLDLSANMAMCLHMVAEYENGAEWRDSVGHKWGMVDNFVGGAQSLIRRGLIEHHDCPNPRAIESRDWIYWRTTAPGRAVLELCRMAGIAPPATIMRVPGPPAKKIKKKK